MNVLVRPLHRLKTSQNLLFRRVVAYENLNTKENSGR